MDELQFPSAEEVIAIHGEILARTGGEWGMLNPGMLHAALGRARRGHYGRPTTLVERAALLLRGIAQGHPFVDGNKRTAWEATDLFLTLNGWLIMTAPAEAEAFLLRVADAREGVQLDDVAEWLHHRLAKVYPVEEENGS